MKALITLFFLGLFLVGGTDTQAQLLKTKGDIIKEYGSIYEADVADDGTNYIVYEKQYNNNARGEYTQHKAIYFTELDNGKEICSMWKLFEPSTETNSTISYFKDNFVEIGYMEYKDYENEILYNVNVDDVLCIVTAIFDNSK